MASLLFIPKGQEDLKWHQPAQKPRFQRLMENGVLYLRTPKSERLVTDWANAGGTTGIHEVR